MAIVFRESLQRFLLLLGYTLFALVPQFGMASQVDRDEWMKAAATLIPMLLTFFTRERILSKQTTLPSRESADE